MNGYEVLMNRNFFNLRIAGIIFLGDLVVGMLGFSMIEGYSLVDALYMVVITISTVGYTEVQPLSDIGKLFSAIYILFNGGLIAYILAVFSYQVIQGEIFKKMYSKSIENQIKQLKNHIIICGYGRYGKEISAHFKKHGIEYLIIDHDPLTIENIKNEDEHILFIEDDATHDEALITANIKEARALISALPEDTDNVFTVLTARQLNPRINIISRAINPKSRKKIVLAGADHVIMPDQIGGFYMAALVTKPDAVEFFSFITNKHVGDVGFEEMAYESAPLKCKDVSIKELKIRQKTGANIIGFKDANGVYHVNPTPDVKLSPGSSFIILGNKEQLQALRAYLTM